MLHVSLRLSRLRRVFGLIWSAAPTLVIAWAILLLVQGTLPVAIVFLTKPLVDGLQAAVGRGVAWGTVRPLLATALMMGGLMALSELIRVALQWISTAKAELVQDHISDLLHAKSAALDLAFFESADFYDRLYRVRFDATSRPLALLESTGSLVQNGITILGIAGLLTRYAAWLPVALLLATLPAFVAVLHSNRRYHAWWMATTTDRRRAQYFGDLLTGATFASEMRLFGLAAHFRRRYLELRHQLRTGRLRLLRSQSVSLVVAESAALGTSATTVGWMVWRALLGLATLGDIALFLQAFQRGQGLMRALLANLGQIYSNSLFLENLFEFLDLEPRVVAPVEAVPTPATIAQEVRFVDVTFRYPGTDRVALDHFDLVIPAGRTIAIVGANGAGKSTIIKLLCRFYDPDSGRIEVDGIDLRRLAPEEWRRAITVLFQSPVQYQGTARENIALGDLDASALADAPSAPRRVEAAADRAGAAATIASLPGAYETLLGKAFPEGTELSGGEWQRIAMARAYHRQKPLVLLDEPTSMLDSWAESEWFDRFNELREGKTAVLITHRLTIARRADVIHVMEHGRIVESGSHDELLGRDGPYARSWNAQIRSAQESRSPS
jgi:ATP-binding cassette, subfamily B, bacterial